MSECWADRPLTNLEPSCLAPCFMTTLINNIKKQANGNIYSIISLKEIFDRHNGGNKRKLRKISKKRLSRNRRLSRRSSRLKGGEIYNKLFDNMDSIYQKCDDGFKTFYNYYNEYLEPSIAVDSDQLMELETKFKNPLSSVIFESRTTKPTYVSKADLYTNEHNKTLFNKNQDVVPKGKAPIHSYVIQPPDLDNKIALFDAQKPVNAFVRKEIVDAVALCQPYMENDDANLSVDIIHQFPIYFNISMLSASHMVTIIKIGTKYYSFGFAFSDTTKTFNRFADMTHIWDRDGCVFSPDSLFKLKQQETMRLVDFGILRQEHIDNLNKYFTGITGIYADYTETVNLNADNTLNENMNMGGKIVLKNLQFMTPKSKYFSFGPKQFSSEEINNCATFTASIFPGRLTCACPLRKRFSLVIDNHPENCSATAHDATNKRCQKLYHLLNTRSKTITTKKLKQLMNYN